MWENNAQTMQQLYKQYRKSNENSIKFSLSITEQRAVGLIPAWSLAFLHYLSECSSLIFKRPPNLSLDGNSSPNRLGYSLILGVNHSLCVIGVGFQLYGQLKKSPYDGMGVLGSFAVSTASQTTRLGKGSSITM